MKCAQTAAQIQRTSGVLSSRDLEEDDTVDQHSP